MVERLTKDEVILFLDRCFASLRQGRRLVWQTPNAESLWGMTYRYGDFSHEICLTSKGVSSLLQLSGFEEIVVRETEPIVHSVKSTFPYVLWRFIRHLLKVWNVAEIGSVESEVFTCAFLVLAIRK